jgi:uncharacterized protein (DUF1697 family)
MATDYIALLRGINVGGATRVAMSDLRDVCGGLGFEGAKTLLQSGNVLFRGKSGDAARIERQLEREIAARLGIECDVIVRTPQEWQAVVDGNPFREEAKRSPGYLLAMLLKQPPDKKAIKKLQEAIPGKEVLRAGGRHIYIVYPDGVGRSKLTNVYIEKMLGTRGTMRNWNTVLRLAAAVVE